MGCFSPVPGTPPVHELVAAIHAPVVDELSRRGSPFVGCLYAGLMLTAEGPRVLEFNCRFGDPETEVLVPLLDGDLLPAVAAASAGEVEEVDVAVGRDGAVTVVLAAGTYPDGRDAGTPIEGVAEAAATGALVFHAGTAIEGGRLVTNGGRILAVTGLGATVDDARAHAYDAAGLISFAGARYRRDIALGVETVPA
jgi:phosphoribosylamine--glycine ligase